MLWAHQLPAKTWSVNSTAPLCGGLYWMSRKVLQNVATWRWTDIGRCKQHLGFFEVVDYDLTPFVPEKLHDGTLGTAAGFCSSYGQSRCKSECKIDNQSPDTWILILPSWRMIPFFVPQLQLVKNRMSPRTAVINFTSLSHFILNCGAMKSENSLPQRPRFWGYNRYSPCSKLHPCLCKKWG